MAAGQAPSPRLLRWKAPEVWWPFVARAMAAERRRSHRKRLPRDMAVDALAWRLLDGFSHVRLFHGCRPVDVRSYYDQGILRHGPAVLDRARRFLRGYAVPEGLIDAAIRDVNFNTDEGRVFLAFDDEHLIKHAGHYLIYGSESLMAITASLIWLGHRDLQWELTRVGRPTLVVCDVPVERLPFHSRREIAQTLYQTYRQYRSRQPAHVRSIDHTVVLRTDVPPEAVVDHIEPGAVVDWHRGGVLYRVAPMQNGCPS